MILMRNHQCQKVMEIVLWEAMRGSNYARMVFMQWFIEKELDPK